MMQNGLDRAPRKWAVGLVPSDYRSLDRIPSFQKKNDAKKK